MARRTVQILVDDLDGGDASSSRAFSYEGIDYTIDLNEEHVAAFDAAIQPWIDAAQRVGGRRRTSGTTSTSSGRTKLIREWAVENGYTVSDRGRLSQEVQEAFAEAHGES